MNADRLLEHFDLITGAPNSVPRLKRLILDLAVRGKLVKQEPLDEPADHFIAYIACERMRRASLGVSGMAQDSAKAPPGGYSIPNTWKWTRLGFLTNVVMGQSPPGETYNTRGEGVPLINGPVEFSPGPFGVTVLNQYTTAPTKRCRQGDLLLCVRGSTTGRTNVAGADACIGRGVAALQSLYDDRFVRLFVTSCRDQIIKMGRGMAFPSISRQQIEDFSVPLPPLAEQHRIVARVDELMELCDELQRQLTLLSSTKERLLEALSDEALIE